MEIAFLSAGLLHHLGDFLMRLQYSMVYMLLILSVVDGAQHTPVSIVLNEEESVINFLDTRCLNVSYCYLKYYNINIIGVY